LTSSPSHRLRVSAVSYLNSAPLVWGLVHGPQQNVFELRFELPAVCAESLEAGTADLGLVPVIEVERQGLEAVPGLGIASDGPVRSILLISRVPADRINLIAMDESSRTSVALARVILAEKYGVKPLAVRKQPLVEVMLEDADAALIIGDPALRYDRRVSPYLIYDLGGEWRDLTGLPMVYAVWAGRRSGFGPEVQAIFRASFEFGRERLADILHNDAASRGFAEDLARDYLTRRIVYELDERCYEGMARFCDLARKHNAVCHAV
jgi:chorismate dehydratase